MNKPETRITYAVEYQDEGSATDTWYVMSGRSYDDRYFRHPAIVADETTSMDEAVEIAEALVQKRSFPHNPRSHLHRTVTRSRVITRVIVGHVSAVYDAR